MILLPNDLPSGGKFGNSPTLNLRPLTFMEILEYSNQTTGNSVKDYIRDIQWLERMDPNILEHSLYDLDYIIFMMKVHTISDNKEFQTDINCKVCGHTNRINLDLSDFKFNEPDEKDKLIRRVKLDGYVYKVSVPTVKTFKDVISLYSLYQKTDKVDVVKLISLFPDFKVNPNEIENLVLNASREDITILYLLETKYLQSVKSINHVCENCKTEGGMAIGISSLIADMFLNVLLNNTVDESKIQFE
jgi:hypothetical protein